MNCQKLIPTINTMKVILLFGIAFLLFIACQQTTHKETGGWKKVFQNDPNGEAMYGDKLKLMDAVRLGYPIRIGWGGNRVEHIADASFLTILDGKEVFAQIKTIVGQEPIVDGDSLKIRFRNQNHWTKIAGTNGYSTGFMSDYLNDSIVGGGVDRYGSTTWYVLYPYGAVSDSIARPLWRSSSPHWEKWNK